MRKLILRTFLTLLTFLCNIGWSQIEQPYPPLNLVSIPTEGLDVPADFLWVGMNFQY